MEARYRATGIRVVQHILVMLNCLPVTEFFSLLIFNKNIFKLRVIYFLK